MLASKSPRRQMLMRELGLPIEVRTLDTDESFNRSLKREAVAKYLAEKKAEALRHTLADHEVLITGDTIVCLEDEILNKPEDAEEAAAMLRKLSGATHTVFTGVCIISGDTKKIFHGATDVTFAALTDEEIEHYIHSCAPFDKAGAYGAQDFIGYVGIIDMQGSFYNVMGFPMHLIYEALKEL